MKRFVAWVAVETDDSVGQEVLQRLLMGAIKDLITRGFLIRGNVMVRQVKDGEDPSPIPPTEWS